MSILMTLKKIRIKSGPTTKEKIETNVRKTVTLKKKNFAMTTSTAFKSSLNAQQLVI